MIRRIAATLVAAAVLNGLVIVLADRVLIQPGTGPKAICRTAPVAFWPD